MLCQMGVLFGGSPGMREVLKCDPYDLLTAVSFPKAAGGRPVQDSFQDHQSQLDVGDVCNLFSL